MTDPTNGTPTFKELPGRWHTVDAGNHELWAINHHLSVYSRSKITSSEFVGDTWE